MWAGSANRYSTDVLILGILGFGLLVGAIAQLLINRSRPGIDWTIALGAGLGGSFVGGMLFSLIAKDGLRLRPSGLIGSIVGAVIVTAVWQGLNAKKAKAARAAAKSSARSGNPSR